MNGQELADLVRKRTIIAIAADDFLMERLVFKGGNALAYIYGITARASYDLDFSIQGDFDSIDELRDAVKRTLLSTFQEDSLVPFDIQVEPRPTVVSDELREFWGGYSVEFKLIGTSSFNQYQGDIGKLRNHAVMIGPEGGKRFEIDISRFEYCGHRRIVMFNDYELYAYSTESIICEKLRAICQQMPEYNEVVKRNRQIQGRSGDFLDICAILDRFPFDIEASDFRGLLCETFKAKRVPLGLLRRISETYSVQESDFVRVLATVRSSENLQSFQTYFNRVVEFCSRLEPLGDE